jgi:hypothetical protein
VPVELRTETRRVVVEPTAARGYGRGAATSSNRRMIEELDGADPSRPIEVWTFHDDCPMFVVGTATLRADPEAPSLRDPGRISVFTGELLVGSDAGRFYLELLRHAKLRLAMWSALAAAAGTLRIVQHLG